MMERIETKHLGILTPTDIAKRNGNTHIKEVDTLLPLSNVETNELESVKPFEWSILPSWALKYAEFNLLGVYRLVLGGNQPKWFCLAEFKKQGGHPIVDEGELGKYGDSNVLLAHFHETTQKVELVGRERWGYRIIELE